MQFPVVLAAAIPMIVLTKLNVSIKQLLMILFFQGIGIHVTDGTCACVQNLIKANWETKHYLTEMCLSTVMNMTKYVGGNVSI